MNESFYMLDSIGDKRLYISVRAYDDIFSLKDCNVQKIVQFNRLLEVKKLVLKSSAGCQINEVQYFLDLSANKAENDQRFVKIITNLKISIFTR